MPLTREQIAEIIRKRPIVPFSDDPQRDVEIEASQEQALQDARDRALMTYGDQVLVPGVSDLLSKGIEHLRGAGEASLAFNPMGEVFNAPFAALSAFKMRPPAPPPTGPVSGLDALGESTASKLAARQSADRAAYSAQAADQAKTAGSTGTVPATSNIDDIVRFIEENRAGRQVAGQRGFMGTEAQADAVRGLGQAPIVDGPWGPNMSASVRNALEQASSKVSKGPSSLAKAGTEGNRVGIDLLYKAYKDTKVEADKLRAALESGKGSSAELELAKQQLKNYQDAILSIQRQRYAEARRAATDSAPTPSDLGAYRPGKE